MSHGDRDRYSQSPARGHSPAGGGSGGRRTAPGSITMSQLEQQLMAQTFTQADAAASPMAQRFGAFEVDSAGVHGRQDGRVLAHAERRGDVQGFQPQPFLQGRERPMAHAETAEGRGGLGRYVEQPRRAQEEDVQRQGMYMYRHDHGMHYGQQHGGLGRDSQSLRQQGAQAYRREQLERQQMMMANQRSPRHPGINHSGDNVHRPPGLSQGISPSPPGFSKEERWAPPRQEHASVSVSSAQSGAFQSGFDTQQRPGDKELFSSSLFSFPDPEPFLTAPTTQRDTTPPHSPFGRASAATNRHVQTPTSPPSKNLQNISAPTTPATKPQPSEEDIKVLTAKKLARAARFYWKPVGQLIVQPTVAGPNQKIEVQWRIPASEVSSSSYNKRESEQTENLDWIGLFRSRKRVDVSDSHILTREIRGSGNVIYNDRDNTRYAVGRIQLRTPRGVGSYDFRYFKAEEEPEPYGGQNEDLAEDGSQEKAPAKLPLARSGEFTVEVQGAALYEALDYVEGSFDDSKRISNATAQLAVLIGQIRTLRNPLLSQIQQHNNHNRRNQRGRHNNRNRNVAMSADEKKRAERSQEIDLSEKLKHTLFLCMEKVHARCAVLETSAAKKAPDLAKKREHFDKLEQERREIVMQDEELDEAAFAIWKEARSAFVLAERSMSQYRREQVSLCCALRTVIDETFKSQPLRQWFKDREWQRLLDKMQSFCPLNGRFFASLVEMRDFYEGELRIKFGEDVDLDLPSPLRGYPVAPNARVNIYKKLPKEYVIALVKAVEILGRELQPPKELAMERFKFLEGLEKEVNERVDWNCIAKLVPFGSSANNFGSVNSDLDICLVLLPLHAQWPQALVEDLTLDEPIEAVKAVEDLASALEDMGMEGVDDQRKLARIPIVKFVNPKGLECDVCINNRLAIRNTMLLHTYSLIDQRVVQLAQIIKRWAKARDINNPAKHTLPSYGYLLLLIRYLQVAGVVPVLQELSPRWNGEEPSERDIQVSPVLVSGPDGKRHDTYFYGDPVFRRSYPKHIKLLQQYAARNTKSTAELLIGFFEFYAFQLDYRRYVVSIRSGEWVTKEQKAAEDSWKLHLRVAIEDPFETGYDVAHVLREGCFYNIRTNFARAYAILVGRSLEQDVSEMSATRALELLFEKIEVEEQLQE